MQSFGERWWLVGWQWLVFLTLFRYQGLVSSLVQHQRRETWLRLLLRPGYLPSTRARYSLTKPKNQTESLEFSRRGFLTVRHTRRTPRVEKSCNATADRLGGPISKPVKCFPTFCARDRRAPLLQCSVQLMRRNWVISDGGRSTRCSGYSAVMVSFMIRATDLGSVFIALMSDWFYYPKHFP